MIPSLPDLPPEDELTSDSDEYQREIPLTKKKSN